MNQRQKRYLAHKKEEKEYAREYRKNHPWVRFYTNAKQRCTNPKIETFKKYGAKGIKFNMTSEDVKKIWMRDEAHKLIRPSIDRIDSKKGYSLNNCQFIELSINSSKRKYGGGHYWYV